MLLEKLCHANKVYVNINLFIKLSNEVLECGHSENKP